MWKTRVKKITTQHGLTLPFNKNSARKERSSNQEKKVSQREEERSHIKSRIECRYCLHFIHNYWVIGHF